MNKVKINDLTVRDGNQSLLATRMEREDILALAAALDKVGFHALEVWGGATFDSAMRFLNQSAWENLREIRKAAPNTKFSMLLRGQNIVGYHHYDNDTLDRFIRLTLENGIDIIRCFDALNDPANVKNAFASIKKHGGHAQAAIAYTVSPVHDNPYYLDLVKTYESMGADSICIKDMSGIITPEEAYELVSLIKKNTDLPVVMHSHATAGMTALVMEQAMRAGVDEVDGCISPFSGGTSHLADETLVETARVVGRGADVDVEALSEAYEVANAIADKYIKAGEYRTRTLIPNPKILTYQVPGGMLSNLMSQLEQQKASDRFNEVLQEVPRVRKDLGYPPLVTPLSQMVGTQAVLNVLLGERYKMSPKEIKDYLRGAYGKAPGKIDEAVKEKILKGEPAPKKVAIDDIPYAYDDAKKALEKELGREVKEEEVISYILFPQQAVAQLRGPEVVEEKKEEAKAVAQTAAPHKQARANAGEEVAFRMVVPGR